MHSDFYCTDERHYEGNFGFYYKDSYFSEPASRYNQSLAAMSLCMALSTFPDLPYCTYDKHILELMKKCGFTGTGDSNYKQYEFNEKPTTQSIGCAVGSKQLADGTTLIAVAIRSHAYEAEWASNYLVGSSGDHEGFTRSAAIVVDRIKDYIAAHEISGRIRIWITGFSRGGAGSTHAAAMLSRTEIDGVSCTKDDVYAYGFATPSGAAKTSRPESSDYSNIYNILHFHDIVPLVAPGRWGFTRYGTTLYLPFTTNPESQYPLEIFSKQKTADQKNTADQKKVVNIYEYVMLSWFREMSDEEFLLDTYKNILGKKWSFETVGLFNRELVQIIASSIGSKSNYSQNFQNAFTKAAAKALEDGHFNIDDASVLLEVIEELAQNPATYEALGSLLNFTKNSIVATGIKNIRLLAAAHKNPSHYLAWMQVMDPNYGCGLEPAFVNAAIVHDL